METDVNPPQEDRQLDAEKLMGDPALAPADSTQLSAQYEAGMRLGGGDPTSLTNEEREEAIARASEFQAEFMPIYFSIIQKLYSVFSLALALLLAGFYKLFFAGRDPTYTFAETLIAACFLSGIYLVLAAIGSSALAPFMSVMAGTVLSLVLLIGLGSYTAMGFYERSLSSAVLGALSGALALVGYTMTIVVVALPIVLVYFMVNA